ncbi:seminase-like [Lucilia sericata]|uniref:seminase-like n=1 Tax=Lucilia sericata TaxID=13632 RepID=UPI0018A7F27D|nr:seminase-like [Lucilia sericata]
MFKLKTCFKLLIICQLVLLQITQVLPQIQSRIVGGKTTTINQVPYLVQLLDNGKFFCGGTLVAPRFVVTAAHCVKGMRAGRLSIVAGATKLSQAGVRSRVSKIMLPKGFSKATMNMDVAVLKLQKPVRGRGIRPTGLCNRNWRPGAAVKVSGWGLLRENARNVPQQVRTVNVRVIGRAKCQAQYGRQAKITKSMFCAAIPGRKDACLGDSGGPAFVNGQFCGIVSWGIGCARRAFPGVYTNVNVVRRFIRNAMKR